MIFDTPLAGTISIVRAQKMAGTCDIIILTGRKDSSREITEEWLKTYNVPYDKLYMRENDDYTSGSEFKEKILNTSILSKYNVLFTIDDDDKCVEMFRRNGIICLQP